MEDLTRPDFSIYRRYFDEIEILKGSKVPSERKALATAIPGMIIDNLKQKRGLVIQSFHFSDKSFLEPIIKNLTSANFFFEIYEDEFIYITRDETKFRLKKELTNHLIYQYLREWEEKKPDEKELYKKPEYSSSGTSSSSSSDEEKKKKKKEEQKDKKKKKKHRKYRVPVITKVDFTQITSNTISFKLPEIFYEEFKAMNGRFYFKQGEKFFLRYDVHVLDTVSGRYGCHVSSGYKEEFTLTGLKPNSFIHFKIVVVAQANGQEHKGKLSKGFNVYTLPDDGGKESHLYYWGLNRKKNQFLEDEWIEKKFDDGNNSVKLFSFTNVHQTVVNSDNTYILLQNGQTLSNGVNYSSDKIGNFDFHEAVTTQIQKIKISPALFTMPTIKNKVRKIACGLDSIVALTNIGEIFSYGDNDYGQLGLGLPRSIFINSFNRLKFKQEFVYDVAAGDKHYLALVGNSKISQLYTWGRNQNIEAPSNEDPYIETEIHSNVPLVYPHSKGLKIVKIAANGNKSGFITMEEKEELKNVEVSKGKKKGQAKYRNQVYVFGDSHFLEADDRDRYHHKAVKIEKLKGKSVKGISIGNSHTLFLVKGGSVYGYGSSKHYQLGVHDEFVVEPILLEQFKDIKIVCAAGNSSILIDNEDNIHYLGEKSKSFVGLNENSAISVNNETSFKSSFIRDQNKEVTKIVSNGEDVFIICGEREE